MARLDEDMWTELFLDDADFLLRELDELHRMVDVLPPEILQAAKQVAAHKPQER